MEHRSRFSGSALFLTDTFQMPVVVDDSLSAKTTRWLNVVLMLAHRLRRWSNIKTTFVWACCAPGLHFTLKYLYNR